MSLRRPKDVTDPAGRGRELAGIEVMIANAEPELARLRTREGRDPSDPFSPVGCLEMWLVALRGRREEALRVIVGHPRPPGPAAAPAIPEG